METFEYSRKTKQVKPELHVNDKLLYKGVKWDLLIDLEQDGYVIEDQEPPSFFNREIENSIARELILKTFNSILREVKPSKWFRLNELEKMIKKKIDDEGTSFMLYSNQDKNCYLFYLDSVEDNKIMYGTFLINETDIQHVIIGVSDERSFVDSTYFHYGGDNNSGTNIRLNEITAKHIREGIQKNFFEFVAVE